MATDNMDGAMKQLLGSGLYSDLEVRCAGFVAKVHRNIVCTRSEWFMKAVHEERFMEGQAGVIEFKELTPTAVEAMLEFLYTGDYKLAVEDEIDGERMLQHLDTYAAGDLLQLTNLKRAAEVKFENAVKKDWDLTCFPLAVSKVYEVAPPGEQGTHLREIALKAVVDKSKEIFEMHNDFGNLLEHLPAFSASLARALSDHKLEAFLGPAFIATCSICGDSVCVEGERDGRYYCPQRSCVDQQGVRDPAVVADYAHKLDAMYCENGHRFYGYKRHAQRCVFCDGSIFLAKTGRGETLAL